MTIDAMVAIADAVINRRWDTVGDKDPYMCIDVNPATIYEQGQPLSMEQLVRLAGQI